MFGCLATFIPIKVSLTLLHIFDSYFFHRFHRVRDSNIHNTHTFHTDVKVIKKPKKKEKKKTNINKFDVEANTFTQCRQREHGTGIMCNINRKIEIKKRTNGRREKSRTREKRHV